MSKRWDTTVVAQVLMRAAPPEEQLDMSLRKLDACRRLAPHSALRVLGVRSGQSADAVEMPVSAAHVCSVVYQPDEGAMWTAKTSAAYCAVQPGTCTTTPCECRRSSDRKIELKTPQGVKCWACAEPGKEHMFSVNALAEHMEGTGLSWWPPYGINCPPILWAFMDWRACMVDCPAISCYFGLFVLCLLFRRIEEFSGGRLPWTRVSPLFGPALKRGEVWRFVTFTFFHLQFFDLFQNVLTMLDTLDIEGTPAIVLGDGSNLKCGVGAKPNFMCYPSIGIGSYHTFGVAIVSAAIGGMCSMWVKFRSVVTGASTLGFGLSGAIVALYGLYAGAELDQATSVQRSFQDWVYLRLIFVAFHIAMEWVRSISQRDAVGLFAHTASFVAGFAYVLHFLPPMGDGTMFPSERPYVVPCAYDASSYGDASAPECVRLFSQVYEYEISDIQHKAFQLFAASIIFTAVNIIVFQRNASSSEAMLLAGYEVSAVVCTPRKGGTTSRIEGKEIILWCEAVGASNLQVADGLKLSLEVRVLGTDPRRIAGGGLGDAAPAVSAEAVATTRMLESSTASPEWKESLFLPVKYSKSSYVQVVLYGTGPEERVALGFASTSMTQALRFSQPNPSEQKLRLQAIGGGALGRAQVRVLFRSLEFADLRKLRHRVKSEIDDGKPKLRQLEYQLGQMQQMQQEVARAAQAEEAS